MHLLAPAKINLHLRVGPPRADGFHPLLSWMCTVGLFDTLELRSAAAGHFRLTCDRPDLPCDDTNLVLRAARGLAEVLAREGRQSVGVEAHLQKRIPMGAGLGGGSSDCATMLTGLNQLWQANWPTQRLAELGARFGSDVPFFFHAPSAICAGRGEIVRGIGLPAVRWLVLMMPRIAMPTPAVYRRFDQMGRGSVQDVMSEPDFDAWATLGARDLLPLLINDLEAPAFELCSELSEIRRRAQVTIGRIVRMSGSGSSLFSLFDSEAEAQTAAHILADALGIESVALPLGALK